MKTAFPINASWACPEVVYFKYNAEMWGILLSESK